jgi:hypothetical protein
MKTWVLPGIEEPFVQDELTFFEKNELFALVTEVVERAIRTGADLDVVLSFLGMSEDNLKKIATGEVDMTMLPSAGSIMGLITRLLSYAPMLMEDMYLIALSVEPMQRETVRNNLRKIDDDTGFGILETLVEQNTETIADFFVRWRELLTNMGQKLRSTGPISDSSPTSSV